MTVKSTVKSSDIDELKYPCLKRYIHPNDVKSGSFIVLFSNPRTGTVVWGDGESGTWEVGYHSDIWGVGDHWKPLNFGEDVVLRND